MLHNPPFKGQLVPGYLPSLGMATVQGQLKPWGTHSSVASTPSQNYMPLHPAAVLFLCCPLHHQRWYEMLLLCVEALLLVTDMTWAVVTRKLCDVPLLMRMSTAGHCRDTDEIVVVSHLSSTQHLTQPAEIGRAHV